MKITPAQTRKVAELALTLEPILDKDDCTTRYRDIEGKTLTDFIIAAINIGSVIEDYARSVLENENSQIFSHFPKALEASNDYKSKKYINTGLLQFLFITIKVRLVSESLEEALNNYIPVIKSDSPQDIEDLIRGFEIGWSTSTKKQAWQKVTRDNGTEATNYYDRQLAINKTLTDKSGSPYQTTKEAIDGFPIIRRYVEEIDDTIGIVKSIENTYRGLHKKNPELKIGFLADLSASAMFLYLSYQDPGIYIVF